MIGLLFIYILVIIALIKFLGFSLVFWLAVLTGVLYWFMYLLSEKPKTAQKVVDGTVMGIMVIVVVVLAGLLLLSL